MDPVATLLEAALKSVAGPEANQALWDLREERMAKYGRAMTYEWVLPREHDWSQVRAQLPKIIVHFEAKGRRQPYGPDALIAMWRGDHLYLFEAPDYFDAIEQIEKSAAANSAPRLLLPPSS